MYCHIIQSGVPELEGMLFLLFNREWHITLFSQVVNITLETLLYFRNITLERDIREYADFMLPPF